MRILSAIKRVEFISDRMSYIILRVCSFHVIVLNFHIAREDRNDDVKARFFKKLE
jgi:hypothetical protein